MASLLHEVTEPNLIGCLGKANSWVGVGFCQVDGKTMQQENSEYLRRVTVFNYEILMG
jgi:hypothetical protein